MTIIIVVIRNKSLLFLYRDIKLNPPRRLGCRRRRERWRHRSSSSGGGSGNSSNNRRRWWRCQRRSGPRIRHRSVSQHAHAATKATKAGELPKAKRRQQRSSTERLDCKRRGHAERNIEGARHCSVSRVQGKVCVVSAIIIPIINDK